MLSCRQASQLKPNIAAKDITTLLIRLASGTRELCCAKWNASTGLLSA